MLKARHQKWAAVIFQLYLTRLFKRHFSVLSVLGPIPQFHNPYPTLLIPNHNTWWDGFFVFILNKKIFHRTIYLMMLEEQLEKYSFFSRVGAYGINPGNPKSTLLSLRYSVELLKLPCVPPSCVCIFPQGRLEPWQTENIHFENGFEWIIQHYQNPINIVPLAIRCEFLSDQRPHAFFLFGNGLTTDFSHFPGIPWAEEQLRLSMKKLQSLLLDNSVQAFPIINGKKSINEKWDNFN